MISKIKNLPIGIPSFEKMRKSGYIYVDKTQDIYNLVTSNQYYFLSRPRRFGKSLLLSTIKELFSGKKALFNNLFISNKEWGWQEYPVIYIDFAQIDHGTAQELKADLINTLIYIGKQYNVDVSAYITPGSAFRHLVQELSKINKVVILIDEYDKPILKHLDDPELAAEMRDVLASFYGPIKGFDPYLRFVMLTGVSKFSRTSLFSELNNLNDISLDERYATMCGYTKEELVQNFSLHIQQASNALTMTSEQVVDKMYSHYDGYRFSRSGERVFNPFSVLLFFDKQLFDNYWFATGTPTFLIKLLKKQEYPLQYYNEMPATLEEIGSFDIDYIPLTSILFQAGYLTIKRYDEKSGYYILGFPNVEVESAFVNFVAKNIIQLSPSVFFDYAKRIKAALEVHDLDLFIQEFDGLLAHINYELHSEKNFHLIFYMIVEVAGMTVNAEFMTARGRIDVMLSTQNYFYIFELKVNQPAAVAMEQIKKKKYYQMFVNKGKHVTLIGMSFDTKERCVAGWVSEDI